jgi:hypothetical protein
MRYDFYADQKDVWKWTLALRLARDEKWVTYVAMFRPSQRDYGEVDSRADERVTSFFESERKIIAEESPRWLQRIVKLRPGKIDPIVMEYTGSPAYFAHVVEKLDGREAQRRDVILVDPDNGIEPKQCGPEHVPVSDLKRVWNRMRPGDDLLIFQYNDRTSGWLESKRRLLENALELSNEAVVKEQYGNVGFLIVSRLLPMSSQATTEL